jgi:hypothetical protein
MSLEAKEVVGWATYSKRAFTMTRSSFFEDLASNTTQYSLTYRSDSSERIPVRVNCLFWIVMTVSMYRPKRGQSVSPCGIVDAKGRGGVDVEESNLSLRG